MAERINFFGKEKTKRKTKSQKGDAISFYLGEPSNVSFNSKKSNKKIKQNNWLNGSLFTPLPRTEKTNLMKGNTVFGGTRIPKINRQLFSVDKKSSLVSSEALLYGKKRLNKYGDKDMDGSPNAFDCSPGRVDKDGFFSNLLHRASGGKWGQSDSDYKAERVAKAKAPRFTEKVSRYISKHSAGRFGKSKEALAEAKSERVESAKGDWLKKYKSSMKRTALKPGTLDKINERIEQLRDKVDKAPTEKIITDKEGNIVKVKTGEGTKSYYKDKLAKMEKYAKEGSETKAHRWARLQREKLDISEKIGPAFEKYVSTPAGKEGNWSKGATAASYRVRGKVAGVLATALPASLLTPSITGIAKSAQTYPTATGGKRKKGTTSRGEAQGGQRGRPKGVYKYSIPGQGPVDVYTWRKWDRKMRAMQRLSGQSQEQLQAQQAAQMNIPEDLEPTKGFNDTGNYDTQQYQAPVTYAEGNLPPDQMIEVKNQQQQYQRSAWNQRYQQMVAIKRREMEAAQMASKPLNPMQIAQLQEQKSDLILNAPSIMRGEMESTTRHGLTYTPPEQNILNAPNANMGQLRNINQGGEIPAVRLSEKPITNPYGDQYTDIDPISGKSYIKTRIREKWADGRAL
jgi:hypothetical protein